MFSRGLSTGFDTLGISVTRGDWFGPRGQGQSLPVWRYQLLGMITLVDSPQGSLILLGLSPMQEGSCTWRAIHPFAGILALRRTVRPGNIRSCSLVRSPGARVLCSRCRAVSALGVGLTGREAWAIRATHEAHMAKYEWPGEPGSCFLTLTYAPEAVPVDFSVRKDVMQRFMKRLRMKIGVPVRYLLCGEYGEKRGRPHFHILLFGYAFPDRRPWRRIRGNQLYRSAELEEVWTEGHVEIGAVTYQSARYVAGYVVKKLGGEKADEAYWRQSPVDGETYKVEPEFARCRSSPAWARVGFASFTVTCFRLIASSLTVSRRSLLGTMKSCTVRRLWSRSRARRAKMAKMEKVTDARRLVLERVKARKVFNFERSVDDE